MASNIKYLTLEGLTKYTSLIKHLIPTDIAGYHSQNGINIYLYGNNTGTDGKYLTATHSIGNGIVLPYVTTASGGLMTASDKTKLNSIGYNYGIITDGTNSATANVYQDTVKFTGSGGTTVSVSNANNNAVVTISSAAEVEVGSTGTGNAVTAISKNGHGITYTLGKTFSETGHTHSAYVNQNAFSNIAVSGQNTVAADSATDTVTFAGAGGLTITTATGSDTVTFTAPEVEVGSTGTGNAVTSISKNGHGITYTLGKSFVETSKLGDYYTKTEVDSFMLSALEYKDTITAGTTTPGAFTPAATKGNVYVVKGSGYINGIAVEEGDMFLCKADNVAAATSSNYSTIQASWNIVNVNWNVVNGGTDKTGRLLPQDGSKYEIAKVGGHSIYVGVEQNTTSGGITAKQTPAHGGTFNIVSGGSFSGNQLSFGTQQVQLPSETVLTATSSTTTQSLSHGGSFTAVATVTGANHKITDTRITYTLPSETTLTKGTNATATATIASTFTAITDYTVSGHTITATKTTYTIPNVGVTPATGTAETPGHGGAFTIISGIETNGHGIKYTTKQITLPAATVNTDEKVKDSVTTNSKYYIVGSTASTATTGYLVKRTNVFVDANGILNSGSTTTCASAVSTHAGTMVITVNDAITYDEINALF